MSRERALDGLIERLVEGRDLGDGSDASALDAAEAARLDALGRVFAGFSKLRDEAAPAPLAAHAAGDRAGAFALVAPLGAGGMGEVWLAERCDGAVEQRVAIK